MPQLNNMKPNPKTGEITLASGTILSRRLSRSMFLSSTEGVRAQINVQNEPWCSFRFEDSEDSLIVVVFFKGESLESISLYVNDPKLGTSWNDWSEPKEMERKRAGDGWLQKNDLKPGKNYVWGSVWSGYSPQSASSSIVIRYKVGS